MLLVDSFRLNHYWNIKPSKGDPTFVYFLDRDEQEASCKVIGLGNTGYDGTRHNVGFMAIDSIYQRFSKAIGPLPPPERSDLGFLHKMSFQKLKPQGDLFDRLGSPKPYREDVSGLSLIMYKPEGYINLSGIPTSRLVRSIKIETRDIVVVSDNLEVNKREMQANAFSGHNGMKSILKEMSNKNPKHPPGLVSIGIGRPESKDRNAVSDYVLGKFTEAERQTISNSMIKLHSIIDEMIIDRIKDLENQSKLQNMKTLAP